MPNDLYSPARSAPRAMKADPNGRFCNAVLLCYFLERYSIQLLFQKFALGGMASLENPAHLNRGHIDAGLAFDLR
jgi:hypothetical protein